MFKATCTPWAPWHVVRSDDRTAPGSMRSRISCRRSRIRTRRTKSRSRRKGGSRTATRSQTTHTKSCPSWSGAKSVAPGRSE
ncbi:hypothetical protein [Roseiarcus sp.]|uniref:hypothetical protein n=1 Tax=Roseiarcus sp. TaxID=1969460 RepID=UPI003BB07C44